MPRKTKAEQQREYEQAQEDMWNDFVCQYPSRFAKVLWLYGQRYSDGFNVGYNKEKDEYRLCCDNDDSGIWGDYTLTPSLEAVSFADQNDVVYKLEAVEGMLDSVDRYKEKLREKEQKRHLALLKLTNEERELLGL